MSEPMMGAEAEDTDAGLRLPFHPRTLLVGILRRSYWLLVALLICGPLAYVAARQLGTRSYRAETVVLYRRGADRLADPFEVRQSVNDETALLLPGDSASDAAPESLETLRDMVKLPLNLTRVRERLGLPLPVQSLGPAIEVRTGRNTSLLFIAAKADSPKLAADLANATRDTFLENLQDLQRGEARAQAAYIEARLHTVEERLADARRRLQDFHAEHSLLNLEQETQSYLNQRLILSQQLEELRVEAASQARQADTAERMVAGLQTPATAGSAETRAPSSLEDAVAVKLLDLRLAQPATQAKVERYQAMVDAVVARLNELTGLRSEYEGLTREVALLEADKVGYEDLLGLQRELAERTRSGFTVVAEAEPPLYPASSTRRLVFMAVLGLGLALGLVVVIGLALADRTLHSAGQAAALTGLPSLGVVPRLPEPVGLPDPAHFAPPESYRRLAQAILRAMPQRRGTILFTSAEAGAGRTTAVANLGLSLGLQQLPVALVDGDVRADDAAGLDLRALIPEHGADAPGLGDYLAGRVRQMRSVTVPLANTSVTCVPRAASPDPPDLLATGRMGRLLASLGAANQLVLLDGAPALASADAEVLAEAVDGVVLVARAESTRTVDLGEATRRLAATGRPLLGVVVVGVKKVYMTRSESLAV